MKLTKRQLIKIINANLISENLLAALFYTAKGGNELEDNLVQLSNEPARIRGIVKEKEKEIAIEALVFACNNLALLNKEVASILKGDEDELIRWMFSKMPAPSKQVTLELYSKGAQDEVGHVSIQLIVSQKGKLKFNVSVVGPFRVSSKIRYSLNDLYFTYLTEKGFDKFKSSLKNQIVTKQTKNIIKFAAGYEAVSNFESVVEENINRGLDKSKSSIFTSLAVAKSSLKKIVTKDPAILLAFSGLDWYTSANIGGDEYWATKGRQKLENWAIEKIQSEIKISMASPAKNIGKALEPLDAAFKQAESQILAGAGSAVKGKLTGFLSSFSDEEESGQASKKQKTKK